MGQSEKRKHNNLLKYSNLGAIIIGRLAQSVERGANNAKVVGSRPTLASSFPSLNIVPMLFFHKALCFLFTFLLDVF